MTVLCLRMRTFLLLRMCRIADGYDHEFSDYYVKVEDGDGLENEAGDVEDDRPKDDRKKTMMELSKPGDVEEDQDDGGQGDVGDVNVDEGDGGECDAGDVNEDGGLE